MAEDEVLTDVDGEDEEEDFAICNDSSLYRAASDHNEHIVTESHHVTTSIRRIDEVLRFLEKSEDNEARSLIYYMKIERSRLLNKSNLLRDEIKDFRLSEIVKEEVFTSDNAKILIRDVKKVDKRKCILSDEGDTLKEVALYYEKVVSHSLNEIRNLIDIHFSNDNEGNNANE